MYIYIMGKFICRNVTVISICCYNLGSVTVFPLRGKCVCTYITGKCISTYITENGLYSYIRVSVSEIINWEQCM
jgi:hypothetical protein